MYYDQLEIAIRICKALICVIEGIQKLEKKVDYPILNAFIINLLVGHVPAITVECDGEDCTLESEVPAYGLIDLTEELYAIIELLQAETDMECLPATPPETHEYDI